MRDIAGLYSRAAPIYAEQGPPYFAHAGQRLVELSDVQIGDRVLDVATGRGAVLLPAARRVQTEGLPERIRFAFVLARRPASGG